MEQTAGTGEAGSVDTYTITFTDHSTYSFSVRNGSDGTSETVTGKNGTTFTPAVSSDGIVSWTNDGGLENPPPVNIKGEKGDRGESGEKGEKGDTGVQGEKGDTGAAGATFTPVVSADGNLSWTNDSGLENPTPVNIKGEKGDPGERGQDGVNGTNGADGQNGATFIPTISSDGTLSWTNDSGLENPNSINLMSPLQAYLIDVSEVLGKGTAEVPIQLNDLNLKDGSVLIFTAGDYYVKPFSLNKVQNLKLVLKDGAVIYSDGLYFLDAAFCHNISIIGGTIDGTYFSTENECFGITLKRCKNVQVIGTTFQNIGKNAETQTGACGLLIFGDCDGFKIQKCTFQNINGYVKGGDGFVHAFGIVVNRMSVGYSENGEIVNCKFKDITGHGLVSGDTTFKGDGDGIFIQIPPYKENEEIIYPECDIRIDNCTFENCKKRGVKAAARGVTVQNCTFKGAFWYACIEMQYGHDTVRNCTIYNDSDYNSSVTSGIVMTDGGGVIEGCTFEIPFGNLYHPGIRTVGRQGASVVPADEIWDGITVKNCYFKGCSRGIFFCNPSATSSSTRYKLDYLTIENCRFGLCGVAFVLVDSSFFDEIGTLKYTQFSCDYGETAAAVKGTLTGFTYPITCEVPVTGIFEIHSGRWKDQLIAAIPNTGMVMFRVNDGNVYAEYGTFYTRFSGAAAPASVGGTLITTARKGDEYIDTTNSSRYMYTESNWSALDSTS